MSDRDRQIEELLQANVPKARIARQLGVARDTVDRVAAAAGYRAARRGSSDVDWVSVRRHYDAGHTAAACQREFGVSPSGWRAAIARGDIEPRPRRYAQGLPGVTRLRVAELCEEGHGPTAIAERLDITVPTVCHHLRNLGVPANTQFARRYDWAEIRAAYEGGLSMRECKLRFGFSGEAWLQAVKRGDIVPRPRLIPLEELLVVGRVNTSRGHLKTRLIAAGIKENRCERCGIDTWREMPLSMQLHHRNGDPNDNRLENLEFLCANCHSQTDTYGGRGSSRRPEPELRLVDDEDGGQPEGGGPEPDVNSA